MPAKSQTWRKKVVEACVTVARAISATNGGTAHTVQLMLADPAARSSAMADALRRAKPADGDTSAVKEYQTVQAAVDLLTGYEGKRI